MVLPVVPVPPAPVLLLLVSLADEVAPPAPPWPVLPVLPGPALVTWPVVLPVVPVVEPLSVAEDEAVALLVTGVPPLVPLVLEVLALVPTVLELVLLVSAVFDVGSPAEVGPPLSSELQPTFQPTRAKSAAGTTRRGDWAR